METPRREFLHQLLAVGALTSSASLLSGCASASARGGMATTTPSSGGAAGSAAGAAGGTTAAGATGSAGAAAGGSAGTAAPRPVAPAEKWDMSWTKRLGKYRTAYDSPEIYGGAALFYAGAAAAGYKAALGVKDSEVTPVLVLRHAAAVMVLDDEMWALLEIGKSRSLKDPQTGEFAVRNPFINYAKSEKSLIDADSGLDTLMAKGAIVLACNNGLRGASSLLRQKRTGLTSAEAHAELRKHVIPGAYVMPNGIFAVSAAQDHGCHYMRVLA